MATITMATTTMAKAIERYFNVALYLLVLTGFGALASTGGLDLPAVVGVGMALALRGYQLLTRRDKDKFYALFSEFHGYEFRSTTTFPAPVATGNTDNNRTFTSLSADWTRVVSSTTIFDLKASYFRFTQLTPGYTAAAQAITPQSIGMTNMIHAPTVSSAAIPNISIDGFTGPLFGSGSFSWTPYNRWILTPSVTMSKGKHQLHFG